MNLKYYLRGLGIGVLVTATIMSMPGSRNPEQLSDAEIRERAKALGMVEESRVLSSLEDSSTAPTLAGEPSPATKPAETVKPTETAEPAETAKPMETTNPAANASPGDSSTGEEADAASGETDKTADVASGAVIPPEGTSEVDGGESGASDGTSPTEDGTAGADGALAGKAAATPTKSPATEASEKTGDGAAKITINIISGDSSYTVARKLAEVGLVSSAMEYDTYLCQNGYDKKLRVGSYDITAGADEETIAKMISSNG